MELIQEEIIKALLNAAQNDRPSKFKDLKKYIGTQYDFIGLSAPGHQAVFKTGFSFTNLPPGEQLKIWEDLWKTSRHYEIMNFALMFVSKHLSSFEPAYAWDIVKEWVTKVDNWAHSDGLSAIYSRLLEKEPELVYAQYKVWNISPNSWQRRQSLVGLTYYSKSRKVKIPVEKLIAMISTLIGDEGYFVQKGLGWTLREMGNIYAAETLAYLYENVASIRPVAFTAAIEKLDADNKNRLKQLRKNNKKVGR